MLRLAASACSRAARPPLALPLQLQRRRREQAPSTWRASSSGERATPTTPATTSAADHLAILQLLHRFDDCLNRGRVEEVGAFFVAQGGEEPVLRVLQPGAPTPVVHTGVPAIAAFFRACAPMARGNRHLLLNSIVEEEIKTSRRGGDAARVRVVSVRSARLLVSATNPPVLRASGVVEDLLVRSSSSAEQEEEWRLASRDLIMDPPAGRGGGAGG